MDLTSPSSSAFFMYRLSSNPSFSVAARASPRALFTSALTCGKGYVVCARVLVAAGAGPLLAITFRVVVSEVR